MPVDSPGVYTSDRNSYLGTIDKSHLKCDCVDGSVENGLRQPILFSFISDKRKFCEPETIQYKKLDKFISNTINFY